MCVSSEQLLLRIRKHITLMEFVRILMSLYCLASIANALPLFIQDSGIQRNFILEAASKVISL